MNTGWSPKPLRPEIAGRGLFDIVEDPIIVKGLSPIQEQRLRDGTPHTRGGLPVGGPPDPVLSLKPSLMKSSLVAKYDERPQQPKMDPVDPMMVVKSYLAKSDEVAEEDKKEMAKSMSKMSAAIQDVLAKTGAN